MRPRSRQEWTEPCSWCAAGSPAPGVREALDQIHQRQAKVLGLILNRADASARSYYYYKYADYHAGENAEHGVPKAESGK